MTTEGLASASVVRLIVVASVLCTVILFARHAARSNVRVRLHPQPGSIRPEPVANWLMQTIDHGRRRRRRRHGDGVALRLAAVLDDMARRSSSGHSLTTSFLAAAHHAEDLDEIRALSIGLAAGQPFEAAARAATPTEPDTRLAVHVLTLCAVQGGGVAESLDRAAATLRERHAFRDERRVHAAQARLSAQVLTVVPVLFASWTALTTASVQHFLTTPVGAVCLLAGIGLNVGGWSLMQRAIRGAG